MLRRSSSGSRCVHEHHCGSQASIHSLRASYGAYAWDKGSTESSPFRRDSQTALPPLRDVNSSFRKKSWPSIKQSRMHSHPGVGDRILWQQDRVMEEDEEEEEGGRYDVYVRRAGSQRGKSDMAQHRSLSMDFWKEIVSHQIWDRARIYADSLWFDFFFPAHLPPFQSG